ncbi:hypothetical protein ACJU26_04815 [Acidithiobacillus sp. M4-SHS-6]|uniref:hypothetical protein n=1 Tax=Acidithiobacillus sp. M4-SHS-6 TaxID=3383024 RepID=UPI0039BE56FA
METGNLKTIKQFCADNKAFSQGGIRSAIFWRGDFLEEQGAICRLGRRVLIDEQKFIELVKAGGLRQVRGAA